MATKVLFIEDDPDVRLVIGGGLKFLEMEVTSVESAEEALKKLEYDQPDVILLDMTLPGMSGWELVKKLQRGIHQDIPVIALTGSSKVGDEQKALAAGCVGYMSKPCEPADVKRLIKKTLLKGKKL